MTFDIHRLFSVIISPCLRSAIQVMAAHFHQKKTQVPLKSFSQKIDLVIQICRNKEKVT